MALTISKIWLVIRVVQTASTSSAVTTSRSRQYQIRLLELHLDIFHIGAGLGEQQLCGVLGDLFPFFAQNTGDPALQCISLGQVIDLAETLPFLAERRVMFFKDTGLFKAGGDIRETQSCLHDFANSAVRTSYHKRKEEGMSRKSGFMQEFKKFILRGNVMDMAVGVIVGGAFTAIVTSLNQDILTPVLAIFGGTDFSNLYVKLGSGDTAPVLMYGNFITAVINFLITAFVIFYIL